MANFGNDSLDIKPDTAFIPGVIANPGIISPKPGLIDNEIIGRNPDIIIPKLPQPGIIDDGIIDDRIIDDGFIGDRIIDDGGNDGGIIARPNIEPLSFDSETGYSAQAKEGSPNGAPLIKVTASSKGFINTPTVSYFILSGDERGIFGLDKDTGQLTVLDSGGLKAGDNHEMRIQAYDGLIKDYSTIKVTVFGTPVFTYPTNGSGPVSASEGLSVNSQIMKLTADGKSGDPNLTFAIISEELSKQFTVDNSGIVSITTGLDYARITQYTFKFRVTNSGGAYIDSVPVIVNVTPNPFFEKPIYTANVNESAKKGTPIITVKVISEKPLIYGVLSGDDGSTVSLNHITGQLTVFNSDRLKAGDNYVIRIHAYDGTTMSSLAYGTINVTVVFGPPVFTYPTDKSGPVPVSEGLKAGSKIMELKADSNSEDPNLIFTIISQEPSDHFTVDNSGIVKIIAVLDYEKITQYTLKFRVSDSTNQSSESVPVIINVTNVNDNIPVFDKPIYTATMLEGAQKGTSVLTANALDHDAVETELVYSIISGNDADNFTLNKLTGELTVATLNLDFGKDGQYSFGIQVSDGLLQSSAECKIKVNAPPTFILPSGSSNTASVEENAAPHTTILQLKAESKMGDTNLVYTIVSQEPVQPAFIVDQNTGELKTVDPIDLEAGVQKYVLTFRVTDSLSLSSDSAPLTVNVTGVNDNPPTFSMDVYTATVSESAPQGTNILKVIGSDNDVGGKPLTYSITAGNDSGHFAMSAYTGQLTLTASKLDYKISNLHTMTVQVSDGKFTDEAKVEIKVIESDGNVPVFQKPEPDSSTLDIEEGLLPETVVYQLEAVGVTGNDNLLFLIASQSPALPAFTVSPKGVLMTPLLPLLADAVSAFEFVFSVSDTNALSESTPFKVSVKQNNYAPKFDFPEYSAQIKRGIRRGIVILNVVARNTSGDTLVYSITGGNLQDTFVLRSDGTLRIDIPNNIDSRVTSVYTIVVQASDGTYVGYTTCKIYVAPNLETPKTRKAENSTFCECTPFNKMWEHLLYTKWF